MSNDQQTPIENFGQGEFLRRRLTSAERTQVLQNHIYQCVGNGARVEYQASPHDVVLVWGKNPNHILHLLITLATFGLWVPFWILIACTMREKREVRHVDDWGNVGITQR